MKAKKDRGSELRELEGIASKHHQFLIRLVYGLAAANFIAVIQLIPLPQFQLPWRSGVPAQFAIVGMIIMVGSIPALFGYALFCDLALLMVGRVFHHKFFILGPLLSFSVAGMGLAIGGIRPLYGLIFLGLAIIALICCTAPPIQSLRSSRKRD